MYFQLAPQRRCLIHHLLQKILENLIFLVQKQENVDSAYHDLKTIAHTPIAIYSLMLRNKERLISKKTVSESQKIIKILKNTSVVFNSGFDSKKVEREHIYLTHK